METAKNALIGRVLNWRLTLPVNSFVIGLALIGHLTNIVTIHQPYLTYLLYYVGVNLISTPWVIQKKFITPEVASPICPYCRSPT